MRGRAIHPAVQTIEPCVKKEQPQAITVASFVANMGKLIAFTAPVV